MDRPAMKGQERLGVNADFIHYTPLLTRCCYCKKSSKVWKSRSEGGNVREIGESLNERKRERGRERGGREKCFWVDANFKYLTPFPARCLESSGKFGTSSGQPREQLLHSGLNSVAMMPNYNKFCSTLVYYVG